MANHSKPNYSENFNYLLECCNITYTQSTYKAGLTIPHCNLGLSTIKKIRSGDNMSDATARKIASAFSLLLLHPEKRKLFAEDLYLPPDTFSTKFPASAFIQDKTKTAPTNMSLFTNKLYRCYYVMPNSPNSCYMAYFKLFENKGYYHAYMVRGIQDFDLVSELPNLFDEPHRIAQYITEKNGDKKTESMHLYEAWNDLSSHSRREDITYTNNRIKIDFHSIEDEPCYSTMFWNTCIPNGMQLESYIGGSCLMIDTNDGKRGKNISAFKMGLEAVENIPASQQAIIKKGALIHDSLRVINELRLECNDGIMTLDNSDDNRWYRFIQGDSYRGHADTRYDDVNVESLVTSLVRLKADYERQLDDLKNYIKDIKKENGTP